MMNTKNILKIFLVSIYCLLLNTSCEQDEIEEYEDINISRKSHPSSIKQFSLNDPLKASKVLKETKELESRLKNFKRSSNNSSLYNFTIDPSLVRESTLGIKTFYTLAIDRVENSTRYFENLVIVTQDNFPTEAYIVKLEPSQCMKFIDSHNSYTFKGRTTAQKIDLESFYNRSVEVCNDVTSTIIICTFPTPRDLDTGKYHHIPDEYCSSAYFIDISLSTNNCHTVDDGNYEFDRDIPIGPTTSTSDDPTNTTSGGGSYSGSTTTTNDEILINPIIKDDVALELNIDLINFYTDQDLSEEQTQILRDNPTFAQDVLEALEEDGEVDIEERIISYLQECFNEVLNDVKSLDSGDFGDLIQSFSSDNEDNIYNWMVNQSSQSGNQLAKTESRTTNHISGNYATTFINLNRMQNSSDLLLAQVLMHEAYHASIVVYYSNNPFQLPGSSNVISDYRYGELLSAFLQNEGSMNDLQHEQFIRDEVVSKIAFSLKEYGEDRGYNLNDSYYTNLAWGGLQDVENYESMVSYNQRSEIELMLQAELSSSQNGDVNPQGARACNN